MTNAPIYRSQVGNRPVGQTYLRNAETAASQGAAVGEALQGIKSATDNIQSAIELRRQIEGDTRVRERTETFRTRSREVVTDYRSTTGTNAVGAARENATDRLERIRQEEAAKIENPREREAFLTRTSEYVISRGDDMAEHESAESRKAATDAYQASVTGYQEDALDHFADDAKFEDNLNKALQEQRNLAGLTGTPTEVLDRADEELITETLTQRVVLMAASDPEAAMQYLESEERLSAVNKQKVKDLLAPAVQEDRVNRYMSQFVIQGSTSGFVASTAQRESGGGVNRQNPNSSAGGLYGYIDSTWNSSLKAAQQAGALPPEYADMSPQELRELKNDDVLATAVMQFDESRYAAAIEATGAEVNDVNKYLIHHFGMGAGPAVLRALQNNPGMAVADVYKSIGADWDGVVAANPGVSYNMTVGELHAYAGNHIGQGGGAPGRGVVAFDFAGAYAFAQTIEDPGDRAAFLATVEAREATEAARRRAASGQVIDTATTRYLETGDSTLSLGEQITLGLDGASAFRDMVAKRESGKLVTDMSTYSLLTEMAASTNAQTRKDFAADGSIEQYINRLSESDYRMFTERRALMRAELEGTRMTQEQLEKNPGMAVPVKPEHRTTIGRHLDRVGVKSDEKNAEKRAQAEYMMETRLRQQMIDFWNANKREPTEAEVDDMLYAQTLQIAPGGVYSDPTLMFQMDTLPDGSQAMPQVSYDEIPAAARADMVRRLTTVLGRTPSPDEVELAYVNSTLIKGQMAPVPLDSMEVPMEVLAYGSALGIEDGELRLHWETYVNQVAAGLIDPNEYPFIPAP